MPNLTIEEAREVVAADKVQVTVEATYGYLNIPVDAVRESILLHLKAYGFRDVQIDVRVIQGAKNG